MRFIDMFCGIGGFRLGLEAYNRQQQEDSEIGGCRDSIGNKGKQPNQSEKWGNYTCVWANDNDKYACQIYRKRFGNKDSGQSREWTRSTECSRPIGDSTSSKGDVRQSYKDSNWDEYSKLHEGDIRAVDASAIPEHDLLCAGFPCQSFSLAGKRRGFEDTRGTLFFEICRVLWAKRPSYLFLENVKGLLSHDNGDTFETIIGTLDELGYDCQWQVLNSKDYGVPQNRERVFIVGHTRGEPRPKIFPIGETDTVYSEVATCLDANYGKGWLDHGQRTMIYDIYNQQLRANQELAGALKGEGIADTSLGTALLENQRIRRLTPLECERLQGFPDGWTEGISDTQRYKCLGNAVTVNVIEAIAKHLSQSVMRI